MSFKIAIVAGPDPGHALPAITLARLLSEHNHHIVVFTGKEWKYLSLGQKWDCALLPGLTPRPGDDDLDSGAKLHQRAGYMATLLAPILRSEGFDVVISDHITACGGLAAEMVGLAWAELHPNPLYYNSRYLPPIGAGLAPAVSVRDKLRDYIMRYFTQKSIKLGLEQRLVVRKELGLAEVDPGPRMKLIATFPLLEYMPPDWPDNAFIIGPLVDEPITEIVEIPQGDGPLIIVSPSTAFTAVPHLLEEVSAAFHPDNFGMSVRLLVCSFHPERIELPFGKAVFARQDVLLVETQLAIGGGGHGFLAKTLLAGVPSVLVPGGGDQWEISQRVARWGSSVIVRPLELDSLIKAAHEVLENRVYACNAKKLASLHGAYDPVEIIEKILCN